MSSSVRIQNKVLLAVGLCVIFISASYSKGTETSGNCTPNQLFPVFEEIAHLPTTGGNSFQAIADGELLIVMDMIGGLRFYNISDPTNPVMISDYYDGGIPHEMFLVDDLLYLADHYQGLEIYNISNLHFPVKLGSITDAGDGEIDGVFVKDDYAFVAEWHDSTWQWSMKVIDVSNSSNPQELVEYTDTDNEFIRFIVEDDICYVSCLESGVKILNVTNVYAIDELAHYESLSYSFNHQKVNDRLYVTDGSGLVVLNISSANSPSLLGNFSTDEPTFGVKVVEDLAFISVAETGLQVLNISNHQNIVKIAEFTAKNIVFVEVQDDLIFLPMHSDGLKILRISWSDGTESTSITPYISIITIPILILVYRKQKKKENHS